MDLVQLALLVLLAPLALAPIFVRSRVTGSPAVRFTEVDPAIDRGISRASRRYLDRCRTELKQVGFESIEVVRMETPMRGTRLHLAVFRNDRLADLATVVLVDATGPVAGVRYVEFRTWLTNGTEVRTQNNHVRLAGASRHTEDPAHVLTRCFPGEQDLGRLYEIQFALVAGCGSDRKGIAPGDETETLRESTQLDNERYYGSPDFQLEGTIDAPARGQPSDENPYAPIWQGAALYRPTWGGAIRMVLRLMWPIGSIRHYMARKRIARESATTLQEIGLA